MIFTNVTVIMRGYNYEEVAAVAETLIKGSKIKNIEVTLNTDNAFNIIRDLNLTYGDKLNIGAGTVLNLAQLIKCKEAGAKFALSPTVMSKEMIEYCKENDMLSIPGAFSPSEIYQMHSWGADYIKVFPSNELSKSYANKVKEPLGDLRLMAVGGVNSSNVKEFFDSGYDAVGTAGGIFEKDDIINIRKENLLNSLRSFENNM